MVFGGLDDFAFRFDGLTGGILDGSDNFVAIKKLEVFAVNLKSSVAS